MPHAVKPIPDGYHTITPHLVLKSAAQAIDFYKRAFGAEELFRMNCPDTGAVVHAEMRIGNSVFMLGDECMDNKSPQSLGGSPVGLLLYVEDVDTSFDRAVRAGAEVKMPVTDMFWGDRFGKLKDPFGHLWSMATHKEDVSPEECAERAKTAFAAMGKPD